MTHCVVLLVGRWIVWVVVVVLHPVARCHGMRGAAKQSVVHWRPPSLHSLPVPLLMTLAQTSDLYLHARDQEIYYAQKENELCTYDQPSQLISKICLITYL